MMAGIRRLFEALIFCIVTVVAVNDLVAATNTRVPQHFSIASSMSSIGGKPGKWEGDATKMIQIPLLTVENSSARATKLKTAAMANDLVNIVARGGGAWLSGINPFGYKMTVFGEEFLKIEGCADSDVGRLIASLKERKRHKVLKDQWLEVVRVAKTKQAMRIYRTLDELIAFCLRAGFID